MLRCRFSFYALLLVSSCAQAQAPYYPDAVWQRKTPAEAGIDAQPRDPERAVPPNEPGTAVRP